jgi:hypothetical protein
MLKWISDSTKNLDLGAYVPEGVKNIIPDGVKEMIAATGNTPLQDAGEHNFLIYSYSSRDIVELPLSSFTTSTPR